LLLDIFFVAGIVSAFRKLGACAGSGWAAVKARAYEVGVWKALTEYGLASEKLLKFPAQAVGRTLNAALFALQ